MLEELRKKTEQGMAGAMQHLHQDLATVRTGKANPALLDSIQVDYFGQRVPLKQVASIAVPDPRLITIQPWDRSVVSEIEKAIMASELGLMPQSDGQLIRLPIPPLTGERRKELVKVVKRMGEETKVAVRNVRRHANEELKRLEKQHELSEDNMHTKAQEIQKLTDEYISKVDEAVAAKEKEILEI
ncbi:MAG: ribosome recycling factor [Candidatus Krumholzibacteria bacterium]|nr:ribosome recycling factor [Candidatus Krumholzibacteria bacterium]